jgi:HAD superfamily hydrolase (TIGR01549 family)
MMPMAPGKAFLLFDLDGTLVRLGWDSPEIAAARARVREIMRELGISPPFGMMVPALAEIGRTRPLVAQALEELELLAAARALDHGGAAGLVASLAELPLAVVTNNGRACSERALSIAGLGTGAFGALICRDDVQRFKPAPESLEKAVSALRRDHGEPARVVMIGDSVTDIQAARALGALVPYPVLTVGVLNGVSGEAALREAGADLIAARVGDLIQVLRDGGAGISRCGT